VLFRSVVEQLRQKEQDLKRSVKELDELHRRSTISLCQQRLAEFRERLPKHYHETRGKNCWQNWIFTNNWLFGVQYLDPLPTKKVGLSNITDYLFPTLNGFVDILEIKRPDRDVLVPDESHEGSYVWSGVANRAIGQVANYIHEMELNQLQLVKKWNEKFSSQYGQKLYIVRPRAFILIGQSDKWGESQKEALRKMNYHLHGIEVLTYSDLYRRGESLISFYTSRAK
jgi:hypothetical protein